MTEFKIKFFLALCEFLGIQETQNSEFSLKRGGLRPPYELRLIFFKKYLPGSIKYFLSGLFLNILLHSV